MKISIRNSAFETNSSSSHAFVVGLRQDVVDWAIGDPHVYLVENQIVRYPGLTRKEFEAERFSDVYGEQWHPFVTPSGDEMTQLEMYGFDG